MPRPSDSLLRRVFPAAALSGARDIHFSVDFWRHPIVLAVIDKVLLGLVALAFGFWFQRRLEVHKRNESLTSEVAKLRIGAYYQVLDQLGTVRRYLVRYEPSVEEGEKTHGAALETYKLAVARQHLLNDRFVQAIGSFVHALYQFIEGAPPDRPGTLPLRTEVNVRLKAIEDALPSFARLPDTEDFFKLPPAAPTRREA